MMTSTYQAMPHHDPTRRAMAPDFHVDYSTYSYSNPGYPMSFNFPASSFTSNAGTDNGFNAFCNVGTAASLYVPPAYTDPRCMPAIDTSRHTIADNGSSPLVKAEEVSPDDRSYAFNHVSPQDLQKLEHSQETTSGTDVDTLMRAIQTKSEQRGPRHPSPSVYPPTSKPHTSPPEQRVRSRGSGFDNGGFRCRKKYQCHVASCAKVFFQKTHLEIHVRAHTGHKPFLCKEISCGQRFSQLGNLKTHERRHTGERPYSCEACGKRFAQRGNVRAHKIVHEQIKPFTCRLESCGKQFTQLGNLKSHQNKFHASTLRNLTARFASMREGDAVSSADKELWEYFATLYKNSNKGIKGRGKDRRIFSVPKDDAVSKHGERGTSSGSSAESDMFDCGRKDETSSISSLEYSERDVGLNAVAGSC